MNTKTIIAGIIAVFFMRKSLNANESNESNSLMSISYLGSNMPRGIRNNNPGNIRIGPSNWVGKISLSANTDQDFEQFKAYVYGVRAMIILLRNYHSQGRDTIRKIINRYAPSSENDTNSYINAVSKGMNVGPDDVLKYDKETFGKLIMGMTFHENGRPAVDQKMFDLAWRLAN